MANLNFTQDLEAPDLWAAENVPAGPGRSPIHVMVQTDGEEPSPAASRVVRDLLARLDEQVLAAADSLLDHYSPEQWLKQGIDPTQWLPEETAKAMAGCAVLRALWLFDETGEGYEMWFTVPWDAEHTYDVEFDAGEPIGCSVND
ncbi:hypothetical protein [Bordetella sp. BOR01]|uniref:hypothetical protein n=1 Tax=Bordetella sp. BOR01 TaxID=2854779 RepID=UPI001C449747|nr:hypothetical protein [Bordetella sp. BOR01]MBV7484167.1 hypothetical protein [Bordetella sp. BOR01]